MCKDGLTYSDRAPWEKNELWVLTDPRSLSLCTASVLVSSYKFFIIKSAHV